MQTGLTPVFVPLLSEFKTKTSFRILIKNYMGHVFMIVGKSQNELVWLCMVFLEFLVPEPTVVG